MTGCTQSCAIHCPAHKPPPQTPVAPPPQPGPPATGAATSVRRLGVTLAIAVVAVLGACPWAAAPPGPLSRPKGPGLRSEYYPLPRNATASDLERATAMPDALAAQLRYDLGGVRETVCAAAACVQMGPDEGLLAWLRHILPRPRGSLSLWGLSLLKRMGLPHADATSLLHLLRRDGPELFLLSGPQWGALLEAGGLGHRGRALDVGAGAGDITAVLGPLFRDPPVATEVGLVSVLRLRLAGVAAVQTPAPTVASVGGRFDAVFLLNVLDRARQPRALLRQLHALVHPEGRLVVALPLPTSDLPELRNATTWAESVVALQRDVLGSAGWSVVSLARAPYLCQGAHHSVNPVFVLDAVVAVLRRMASPDG